MSNPQMFGAGKTRIFHGFYLPPPVGLLLGLPTDRFTSLNDCQLGRIHLPLAAWKLGSLGILF